MLISDSASEHNSHDMQKECNEIETTLRVLEDVTPWENKDGLYVGLIKE